MSFTWLPHCAVRGSAASARPSSANPSWANWVHRYVAVAGDVRHLDATESVLVHVEPQPTGRDLLDRDAALQASKRGAEAAVHAVAEADRDTGRAFDVELVGP